MEERWRLEDSDNELKFFFDDKLIIHLYNFQGLWHTSVLGCNQIFKDKNLSDAIQTAKATAIEHGWLQ
jgi:hypothetical protein